MMRSSRASIDCGRLTGPRSLAIGTLLPLLSGPPARRPSRPSSAGRSRRGAADTESVELFPRNTAVFILLLHEIRQPGSEISPRWRGLERSFLQLGGRLEGFTGER